jgi:pyruvate formate-lyase activating enzyme-like uncharacterized protein
MMYTKVDLQRGESFYATNVGRLNEIRVHLHNPSDKMQKKLATIG